MEISKLFFSTEVNFKYIFNLQLFLFMRKLENNFDFLFFVQTSKSGFKQKRDLEINYEN